MKRKLLYCVWAFFYILCASLGHIVQPAAAQSAAMTALSLVFFIPGLLLLVDSLRTNNKKGLLQLRWICVASLALTLLALIANIMCANASEAVGNVFYVVLIWVSSPMICSQHWVLSLFLWACLLFSTFLKKTKC